MSPEARSFTKRVKTMFSGDQTTAPPRGKILVVDDEPNIRELLSIYLKGKGYEVFTAADGEEALSMARRQRPHLVLLDIMMPNMDGMTALKRLREADPSMSIIMSTALTDLTRAQECLKLGAVDYITKPFHFQYIESTVAAQMLLLLN